MAKAGEVKKEVEKVEEAGEVKKEVKKEKEGPRGAAVEDERWRLDWSWR